MHHRSVTMLLLPLLSSTALFSWALQSSSSSASKISRRATVRNAASTNDDVTVLMSGLPGAMGFEVSAACLRKGFELAPLSLTGPDIDLETVEVTDLDGGEAVKVELVRGPSSMSEADCDEALIDLKETLEAAGRRLIAIDYTHPTAVNNNAALYARLGIPFVMGTTGGDRDQLKATVIKGAEDHEDFAAVVAPNMGKQIVALQATLERMARDFPGSFAGYELKITESHQSTKADTSGTAKAIAASLGVLVSSEEYDTDRIVRVRDVPSQLAGAPQENPSLNPVPEAALKGHAFHTYSLVSPNGDVEFQWRHNVVGRRFYAEGTADAVAFLNRALSGDDVKPVYDMVDVLEAGALD